MRFALGVEYDGRAFQGWQRQPDRISVQESLENALHSIAGEPVSVVCAGRTDAGVHAITQVVHFDTEVKRPLSAWVRGVNTFLPASVAVRWAHPVSEDFHARFSAEARRYRYLLMNRPQRPGLLSGRVGWTHRPLDVGAMKNAVSRLLGGHDFSAFRAADCQAKNPFKTMFEASVREQGDFVIFDFQANAFLQHMIRNMVGSLVYIGYGQQAPEWIDELLQMKDRKLAAPTFSADGLYLVNVSYPSKWVLPETVDADLTELF